MAGAVMAMKDEVKNEDDEMEAGVDDLVQYFLNRLYMSHISVRMLINQYAFAHGVDFARDGYIGKINPYSNVAEVVNKAYNEAAHMCDQHYENHPGIEMELIPSLFKYTYTTAGVCEEGVCKPHEKALAGDKSLMAGLGYGLPLARLYAQYFHGNSVINSMAGYGTDTYVYLKSVEADAPKKLPLYSSATHKMYKEKQGKGPAD